MTQIDRIREAEEAIRQLVEAAAQLRLEIETVKEDVQDPNVRRALLEAAEGFESQAQDLREALREWREDIH